MTRSGALSEPQEAVLRALGRFRYLTATQLEKTRICPSTRNARDILRTLNRRNLSGVTEYGPQDGRGRLSNVYHLTERGKKALCEIDGEPSPLFTVKSATQAVSQYAHRLHTIDTHVCASRWCEDNAADLDYFDVYFDHGAGRAKTHIPHNQGAIIPDAMFQITVNGITRLFAAEIECVEKTARNIETALKFAPALADYTLEDAYDLEDGLVRVLLILKTEKQLELMLAAVSKRNDIIDNLLSQTFVSTIDRMEADFLNGWFSLQGDRRTLFKC